MNSFIIEGVVSYSPETHTIYLKGDRPETQSLPVPASLCLLELLENYGEVVSQNTLLENVWSTRGMTVTANTLYQNIFQLRRAFSKAGIEREIITTVPRKGFMIARDVRVNMFIAESQESEPLAPPALAAVSQPPAARQRSLFRPWPQLSALFTAVMTVGVVMYAVAGNPHAATPELTFHELVNARQDCHIFRNHSENSDSDYLAILQRKDISCQNNAYIYISHSPEAERTAIYVCDSAVNRARAAEQCDAFHYRQV